MPQAAWCSQCGTYVYVQPDGRCQNGHGAESLSHHYEAPEPGAQASAAPQTTQLAPRKSHVLTVVLVILGLFVLCSLGSCCAAMPLYWKCAVGGAGCPVPLPGIGEYRF